MDAHVAVTTQIPLLCDHAAGGQRCHTFCPQRRQCDVSRPNVAGRLHDAGREGHSGCHYGRGKRACAGHWTAHTIHRRYVSG